MTRSTTLKIKSLTPKSRIEASKSKVPARKSVAAKAVVKAPKRRTVTAKAPAPVAAKQAVTAPAKVKTDFVFAAPEAKNVVLAGSFTDWQSGALALRKLKGGVWKTTVVLARGNYEYRFIVDGQWQDDPTCETRIDNSFGVKNCLRVIA